MAPSLSRRSLITVAALALSLSLASCQEPGGEVDNVESARRAYLGLDRGIDRALKLGFDGYNAASNANIPEQSEPGAASGLMVVGGQVDAGVSNNKEMRLLVTLSDDYADGAVEGLDIAYNGGPAKLDVSMQGLPNASLTGTLSGGFLMSGDLAGNITLDLQISGTTEAAPDGTIRRKAGTIRVVGTATSDYGVFDVDVSL